MTFPATWAPVDEDALRRAYAAAEPFPFVSLDGFLEPGFARELASSLPSLEDARQVGREFRAVNERGKVQVTRSEHFAPAVRALNELMASPRLLALLERITGIRELLADEELVGGGIHVMGPGSHLDVHVDFNRIDERGIYRRLNALLFLNEEWRDEWGGELELWDARVNRRHHAFAPRLNRLVLFETSEHSYHGVRRVRCP
jgi:2-oxoglutarate-Fe(II)-dependent oxygenase superfamily protein